MVSRDRMVFSARPVFIGWITFLMQLPLQLFFTFWAGLFFGGISKTFVPALRESSLPIIIFGALAFFGVPVVAYFGKLLNYSRTEYRFFTDRLEFEEGFFSINKKVVSFRNVKEVTLRKGIFQRIYGLGTVYLATLATGSTPRSNPFVALGFGNVSASGINVRDVREPDAMYERIRQMVDAANPGSDTGSDRNL